MYLCKCLCFCKGINLSFIPWKVFSGSMFMGIFGSGSPKPHRLYSNDKAILEKVCSEAGHMSRDAMRACDVKTTRRYIDRNGKRRCVGIKPALKASAYLSWSLFVWFSKLYPVCVCFSTDVYITNLNCLGTHWNGLAQALSCSLRRLYGWVGYQSYAIFWPQADIENSIILIWNPKTYGVLISFSCYPNPWKFHPMKKKTTTALSSGSSSRAQATCVAARSSHDGLGTFSAVLHAHHRCLEGGA